MNTSSASLTEALQCLAAVVDELLHGETLRALSDAEIRAITPVAEAIGRRSDALRVMLAGEIDDRSRVERGDARM